MSGSTLIRDPAKATRTIGGQLTAAVPPWETAVVCLALFMSTSALIPLLFGSSASSAAAASPNDPISRKVWLLVVLFVLFALVRFGGRILSAVMWNPGIAGICYLALASTLWSGVPGVTLKYALELAFSTLLGLYVGVRFGTSRLVAILSWTTAVILFLSIAFALLLPRYGLDPVSHNAWRGIFTTKNQLGRVMVTGLIVWVVRTFAGESGRFRGCAMVLAFAVVGVESGSRTALGVSGLMLGVFVLVWLMAREDQTLVPVKGLIVSALALTAALSIVNLKLLLAVVGSDYSLTGRAGIWSAVWQAIKVHPWLGYGFDAFWRGSSGPSLAVWRASGVQTPHSHNGYLDLLLALGTAGLVFFAIALAAVWRRSLTQLREGVGSARTFPIVYLSLLLLYNLTESSLVSGRSLEWILFAAVAGAIPENVPLRQLRRPIARTRRAGRLVAADEP